MIQQGLHPFQAANCHVNTCFTWLPRVHFSIAEINKFDIIRPFTW